MILMVFSMYLEPKCTLIAVFMWQDHCYLMRRKELATELEQQGITASRMSALEIQDFMCCNVHSLQFREFSQNVAVHILTYCIYRCIIIDYRHIRNTFFWVIFLSKDIAKGILGLNATCRNVCVVGRLFQGWDPEDPWLGSMRVGCNSSVL